MDNWLLPLIILPGIGMLILSTSHLSSTLEGAINGFLAQQGKFNQHIVAQKIKQLGLLSKALVGLYIGASCMALAGLLGGIEMQVMALPQMVINVLICLGIVAVLISLGLLIFYAIKAVRIKQDQFQERLQG